MPDFELEEYLLKVLIDNQESIFPENFHIIKVDSQRESPDVSISSENLTIGIEITQAMEGSLKKEELENKFLKIFHLEDVVEKSIVKNIKKSIRRKMKKLGKYTKFDENWLYIYHEEEVLLDANMVADLVYKYLQKNNILYDVLLLKLGSSLYKMNKKFCIKIC